MMHINYLILAHDQPSQLDRLVKRLQAPDVSFYIHIDKSKSIKPFQKLLKDISNVHVISDSERVNTPWSNIGSIKATLKMLKRCVVEKGSKGYCVLLSGKDYPLKGNQKIKDFFRTQYGKNFINISDISEMWPTWKMRYERYNFHLPDKRVQRGIYPITDYRFTTLGNARNTFFVLSNFGLRRTFSTLSKPKRKHPNSLAPKGGSAWWALPNETINELLLYLEEYPDILKYHNHTHVPDETFFQSILHKLKSPQDIEKSVTYVNWKRKGVSLPVTFETNEDFEELSNLNEHYLFARKFGGHAKMDILDRIDKELILLQ